MYRLLIIEDDATLAAGLSRALRADDIETEICGTLREARRKLSETKGEAYPDGAWSLLLLDVNLPDGDGFDFLAELRRTSRLPVVMLTANDMETDVVTGLELGADDYITKPFSLAVLRARVRTQLRKAEQKAGENREAGAAGSAVLRIGPYAFDFEAMRFTREGEAAELSKTEQKLLRILVENRGQTLERGRLIDRVWTDGAEYVDENALSVAVKRLRDKLKAQAYIKTVYGVGYTWVREED
ncbi:MAG: response regulator transcription factor [Eubacteriales bacterium]|nr:response regulator transcription factor [Eubacteriales bacterium]